MHETRRAVLERVADGPVTGPTLADALGVSRAAVWKHVEALRADGFRIDSTDDGYVLEAAPEFGGAAVELGLDAPFDLEYHDSVASTNDRARELAAAGRDDVVVLADEQTGGRGRRGRAWASPSGGIWLSLVLRPDWPPARVPLLTLAAAVAVTDAARARGVDAAIKWPNDVLVPDSSTARGGRKLTGILTEMEGEAGRVSWVVLGVGVNANLDPDELGEDATSLRAERGDVDRAAFTRDVLERFHGLRAAPDDILDAWRDRSATLGQRVRVRTAQGPVEGDAVDVTDVGALVVDTDGGEEVVHAGDCEHLRPA
ncbi:biotin--[acetyl-CoA-carboxylase] ligase [Halocalculus aciditolerans]|uniref:Bifunctional biotin--[acetyl-CoA-carboxylase] synthetase/biotin operon repressor n=1 Tax=Halocalculus aciditolerans TaxID=1383812 RepID=A0A830FJE2_9EURY|nr:biotin--[acetyl-CoA-carboxylase] ligase [Halocalculus aciditolerans]GGL52752.1 bifunctional biotin--[acetyl-CoA-carboxylase] synthetase/biotin operon repressor [Halocalculus aciditolerans]